MSCFSELLVVLVVTLFFSNHTESGAINYNDGELYDYSPENGDRSGENSCVYTFKVPKTDASICPNSSCEVMPEVNKENFQDLKDSLLSQFNVLKELITNLSQQTIMSNRSTENDHKSSEDYRIGTHYTRWGSMSCPGTVELIYSGMVGISHHSQGGGVNYLCLPKDPDFEENIQSGFQTHSDIYGVSYQSHGSKIFSAQAGNKDAPCSVCHVSGRGESLMIPAKKTCPNGWTLEYQGILMAEHYTHRSSDFVCVDKNMDVSQDSSQNSDGGLLYVVESHCGSLKCPPYADGKEILCVVCTK